MMTNGYCSGSKSSWDRSLFLVVMRKDLEKSTETTVPQTEDSTVRSACRLTFSPNSEPEIEIFSGQF